MSRFACLHVAICMPPCRESISRRVEDVDIKKKIGLYEAVVPPPIVVNLHSPRGLKTHAELRAELAAKEKLAAYDDEPMAEVDKGEEGDYADKGEEEDYADKGEEQDYADMGGVRLLEVMTGN